MIWLMRYSCWRKNLILDEEELHVFKSKIEDAKIPETDEWSKGLNAGLSWALRILDKDKSAY